MIKDWISNYNEAYEKLYNSNTNLSWFFNEKTQTRGIMWHFTDINNMASILSTMEIMSKNKAVSNHKMKNNNSSPIINDVVTPNWVHDYARFYLRPKTPTQYRNEGIYPKNENEIQRLKRGDEIWTDGKLAHLPIPVFIGFDLLKFLKEDLVNITKESLASRKKFLTVEDAIDNNLDSFKKNILNIYSNDSSYKKLHHTEVICKRSFNFSKDDIIKIVVRSEPEKRMLINMLCYYDDKLIHTRKGHNKINLSDYIDKIEVDDSFFFNDGFLPLLEGNELILKQDKNNKIVNPSPKVIRIAREKGTLKVLYKLIEYTIEDINEETKRIGMISDPSYIIDFKSWKGKNINRYYWRLYIKNKLVRIYSQDGLYYRTDNDVPFEVTDDKYKKMISVLRRIEDAEIIDLQN